MNEVLIKGGQLLLSLSILIVLHELGHYLAARWFGVRVEKFYLFFNPWFSLLRFRYKGTEYGVGWLPLGGYVKIAGMVDESLDREQLRQPPQPYEFRSKPAWQRLIIMLGGIIMNVLLGVLIYWMLLLLRGEQYLPVANMKYGIAVDSIGAALGFQDGDRIVAIDGEPVENFAAVPARIIIDRARTVTVERNGRQVEVTLTDADIAKIVDSRNAATFISVRFPFVVHEVMAGGAADEMGMRRNDVVVAVNDMPVIFYHDVRRLLYLSRNQPVAVTVLRDGRLVRLAGTLGADGLLGVRPYFYDQFLKTESKKYNIFTAFPAGISKAWATVEGYAKQFALIFSPEIQGYKHLGGFITIASAFSPVWDWEAFWSFTGFLSLVLAFMNLLPIPALDGGHVLFTLVEMVTRRKPGEKFLEYAQIAGMVFLLALILYANGNDIFRIFR
ncbi:MAG: RIP metalloprotease RseP [Chitinophagales bacterium]|nr:RIP metalloprotease RseP [Chitinophagales bacterium]MDW8428324.1 RIP metalloprotease RseP [Chitinophagales bacterium]